MSCSMVFIYMLYMYAVHVPGKTTNITMYTFDYTAFVVIGKVSIP